jgi:hypothetical protein
MEQKRLILIFSGYKLSSCFLRNMKSNVIITHQHNVLVRYVFYSSATFCIVILFFTVLFYFVFIEMLSLQANHLCSISMTRFVCVCVHAEYMCMSRACACVRVHVRACKENTAILMAKNEENLNILKVQISHGYLVGAGKSHVHSFHPMISFLSH